MKVSITGKEVKFLEDALPLLVKIRQMGRSLGDVKYSELATTARNSLSMILGKLEVDAVEAGLKGDIVSVLNKRPIKFEV